MATKTLTVSEEFQAAFDSFVNDVQMMLNSHYTDGFTYVKPPILVVDPGRRYIRVWKQDPGDADRGSRGSAYFFVDKTNGDVLKPATWKAPAKHARTNIFAEDRMKFIGPYGVAYLR